MKTLLVVIIGLAIGWFSAVNTLALFWFWNFAKMDALLPVALVVLASFALTLVDPQRWWAVE